MATAAPATASRARRPRPATVVIVGSINMDLVAQVPRLPRPGETLAGSAFATLPGGKGANQAVAVARLGGRAILIGCVGDDTFGHQLLTGLRRDGVDTRRVRTLRGTHSGVAIIAVEASGQNAITIIPGANARLRPVDVLAAEPVIARADAVLAQLEIPLSTVEGAFRMARRHSVMTVLDAAPVPPAGIPGRWRSLRIDVLSPNETECRQLTGLPCETDAEAGVALDSLTKRYAPRLTVLKRGDRGALVGPASGPKLSVGAFAVNAIDTTAAGDAFTAALTVRLAEGAPLPEAVRFACAAGALAVTRLGAQPSMPTRAAVERFLRRNPHPPEP